MKTLADNEEDNNDVDNDDDNNNNNNDDDDDWTVEQTRIQTQRDYKKRKEKKDWHHNRFMQK